MDLHGSPWISIDLPVLRPRASVFSSPCPSSWPRAIHTHGPTCTASRLGIWCCRWGGARWAALLIASSLSCSPLDCRGLLASAHYGRHPCFGRCGRSFRRRRAVTFGLHAYAQHGALFPTGVDARSAGGEPLPSADPFQRWACVRAVEAADGAARGNTRARAPLGRRVAGMRLHEIARDCMRLHAIACDCTSLHAIACDCH